MRIVITCLFCFSIVLARGQITQPARFEIEEKHGANSPLLIGMKEKGIAFLQDKDKINDRKNQWDLILLDTLLQEKHRKELWLEPKLKLVGYDFLASHLFFLFREGDTHLNNLILLKINIETFEENRYTIKQQVEFKLSHFSMLTDAAVFGGYIGNEPAVILFDTEKENLKILPGFFLTDNELLDVRVNKNNTFNVLLVDRGNKESKKIVLRTYDSKGTQLLEDIIDIPQGKTIISGITSGLDRDELLIVGGWGSEKSKMANGVFSLLVDPFEKQEIQFYRFSELKHSFDFMNPKRAERVKNRETENQKKNRKPLFKNPLNIVKLEESTAGFTVLAEMHSAFAPSGSNPNPYSPYSSSAFYYGPQSFYSPYANRYSNMPFPYYSNRQMGEQVFHSLVISFDHQGKLVNDYGLAIENKKLPSLDQVTDFVPIPTGIAQAYKKESDLILHIHEANDVSTLDTMAVQLKKPGDKLKFESTEDDGIRSWYKNVFFTWGYCTIKDTDKSIDASRNVFYITKVKVK
jgi:hypothetical protein